MDDYDIPFDDMSEEEFLFRAMNENDPMYMGSRTSSGAPCRNYYANPNSYKGWGSQWSLKKQFFMGMLIGAIVIGVIVLLAWLGHIIFG